MQQLVIHIISQNTKIMETSLLFDQQTLEQLTLSPQVFRVRLSQLLEKDVDLKTHEAHYFLKSHGFVPLPNPNTYYSKTLRAYLTTTVGELLASSTKHLLTLAIPLNSKWSILSGFCPKIESEYTLSDILQEEVDQEYFLSEKKLSWIISGQQTSRLHRVYKEQADTLPMENTKE